MTEDTPLAPGVSECGRALYGPTPPSAAEPCARTSALSPAELDEVVELIASGRLERAPRELPVRLWTRDWASVERVVVGLDRRLARARAGWKVGAASEAVQRAEGLPGPTPGVLYAGTVFDSGAALSPELFVNYRNCECEFAFRLGRDFAPTERGYDEREVADGIAGLLPVVEIGDCVFPDWYGASSYFGTCLDNGGGAALVIGELVSNWRDLDLAAHRMDVYLNGAYIKSGVGEAAMGHPLTSAMWLVNWLGRHGLTARAGEIVSTGTCTGHLFATRNDQVRVDFGALGTVEATFA